jgi:DNA-binding CsgD family transcriptional regulator
MGTVDGSRSDRLDRLNPVERELLILLGRGHTAKTIATLKGLSVAAINERFRAARRKTGLGSSREIARLLTAQENRHDLIDLASAPAAPPNLRRPDAPPSRASFTRRWRLPMIATGLFAVALIAQQTAPPPARPAARDSLAAEILARQPPGFDIEALHAEVAGGDRDPAWSAETESALSRRYHLVPDFTEGVQSLSITCATTLCEVAGITREGLPTDAVTDLMTRLQALGHPDRVPGLVQLGHQFSTTVDRPPAFVFVSYWRRD